MTERNNDRAGAIAERATEGVDDPSSVAGATTEAIGRRASQTSSSPSRSTRQTAPKFPIYEHLGTRIRSYDRPYEWPYVYGLDVYDMARSGFYYSGVDDITLCYMCGLALSGWREALRRRTMVLWEHRHWAPACPLQTSSATRYHLRHFFPCTRRLPDDPTQRCSIPGLNDEIRESRDALTREEETYSALTRMFKQCRRVNLDVLIRVRSIHDHLAPLQDALHRAAALALLPAIDEDEADDEDAATIAARHEHHYARFREIARTVESLTMRIRHTRKSYDVVIFGDSGGGSDDDGGGTTCCVVCLNASRSMLFVPCRHFVCCESCARRLFARGSVDAATTALRDKRCPVCRGFVWLAIKAIA